MKYLFLIFILFSTLFCKQKSVEADTSDEIPPYDTIEKLEEFEYVFTDSTTLKNKSNIYKFSLGIYKGIFIDTLYIESALYKKDKDKWLLLQYERESTSILALSLETDVIDLNEDGFKDFIYTSGIAARGANRVNSCIIYNPKEERYIRLHNAINYPSISYNKKLKCLDSQAIYGGSTTSFLRIQGDSLFNFAKISVFGYNRNIVYYDNDGSEKIILEDTLGDPSLSYHRFSDYHLKAVLKEYEEARAELRQD